MRIKFYKKFMSTVVLASVSLYLTGCTGMSGSFSCNDMPGDSCTPVSVINQQVDNGTYDAKAESSAASFKQTLAGYDINGDDNIGNNPIRQTERTKRIWIAPYVDMQDNFHQANTVYTVLTKPYWIGASVSTIRKQG